MRTKVAANIEHYLFNHEDQDLAACTVLSFFGQEGISQLMQFSMELFCPDPNVDISKFLNKRGSMKMWSFEEKAYSHVYHGVVRSCERIAAREGGVVLHLELISKLWWLTLNVRCRIFQDMTVPQIIEDVLKSSGLQSDDYRLELKGNYEPINKPPREFCVQYRESDYDFIMRSMEDEGIFYFFEYTEEKEVVVIADTASSYKTTAPMSEVRYDQPTGLLPLDEEVIYVFRYKESVLPTRVSLKGFNPDTPQTNLLASSQIHQNGSFLVYDGPERFGFMDRGTHLARVRNEKIETGRKQVYGKSNCRSLLSGHKFTLQDHTYDALNREFLLTQVTHQGTQGAALAQDELTTYENQFECVLSDIPYHPPATTPRPVIQGTQTAIVVGPKGEEIYVDEKGRIKVQFHWDVDGEYDEKSSCWVPVNYGWAGPGWGNMFIPRIGWEVNVAFIDGDPDQPMAMGARYNGDNRPPYPLPAEKTKSTIKSNSSTGGKGFNEIRFEDKKGSEQIFIHAEKDVDFRVKADRREYIGNDRHLYVYRDKRERVKRDTHILIERDAVTEIKRDRSLKVTEKDAVEVGGSRSVVVKGDVIEEFKANHSEKVTSDYYLKAQNIVIEATTGLSIKIGGNFITINSSGIFFKGTKLNLNSGGSALSGNAPTPVPPVAPLEAELADKAEPGDAGTYKFQRAQLDPVEAAALNAPWHQEPEEEDPEKTFIEVELLDENDEPVVGERFWITLPDGTTLAQGRTDENGIARVDGVDPGQCKIVFPDLGDWEPK